MRSRLRSRGPCDNDLSSKGATLFLTLDDFLKKSEAAFERFSSSSACSREVQFETFVIGWQLHSTFFKTSPQTVRPTCPKNAPSPILKHSLIGGSIHGRRLGVSSHGQRTFLHSGRALRARW